MFVYTNPNPHHSHVGDCAVRACCIATGQAWERTFIELCLLGLIMGDMPSANAVWGRFLRLHGFTRHVAPDADGYTLSDFAAEHGQGLFVVAMAGHVVAVRDGDWLDTWDSGRESPLYYWTEAEHV